MRSGGNYVAIGNTLIMFNLDPMDTDRYTCVARNFAGVTSATSTLKVHGKNKYTLPFVTLCSQFPIPAIWSEEFSRDKWYPLLVSPEFCSRYRSSTTLSSSSSSSKHQQKMTTLYMIFKA